jgi:hypothetical protein
VTTNKAHKRAVRARMRKTGERYTTARQHQLDPNPSTSAPLAASAAQPEGAALPPRVAEPGLSDAAILRGSGRTWDQWFGLLDAWGAASHSHAEIARYVESDLGVGSWYAQSITVGYERARGLRAVNQSSSGFSVNVSRTLPVPIERLFDAFLDEFSSILRVRTKRAPRSARFDMLGDQTRVLVGFTARSPEKSSVALSHVGLTDAEAVEAARLAWRANLDRLAKRLQQT